MSKMEEGTGKRWPQCMQPAVSALSQCVPIQNLIRIPKTIFAKYHIPLFHSQHNQNIPIIQTCWVKHVYLQF